MSGTVPGTSIPWSGVNAAGAAAGASAGEVVSRLVAPGVAIAAVEPLRQAAADAATAASDDRAAAEAARAVAEAAAVNVTATVANAAPSYATLQALLDALPDLVIGQLAVVYADPGGDTVNGQWRVAPGGPVRESSTVPVIEARLEAATRDAGPFGIDGQNVALAAENDDGGLIPYLSTAGRLLQVTAAGAVETVMLRGEVSELIAVGIEEGVGGAVEAAVGEIVPSVVTSTLDGADAPIVLLDGAVPERVWIDPQDRIIRAETRAGELLLAGADGLMPVGGGAVAPAAVLPAYTTTVPGWSLRTGSVRYIILMHGQSNAEGVNAGTIIPGEIISGSPIYPAEALMPSVGLRTGGARYTDLVPLVEANNSNRWETAASACANHLIRDIEAALGVRPQLLLANTAVSGLTYAQLTRGSQPYARLLLAAQDAVAACRVRGETPVILGIDWVQGEAEVLLADEIARQRQLLQLHARLDADLRAISGQSDPVVLYVTQTSHHLTSTSPVLNAFRQPIAQADVVLDGMPGIRAVGPLYHLPYGDQIHIASIGQYRRGQAMARAIAAEAFGVGWSPIKALSARWLSATEIEVEYSRGGLVIDTTGAVVNPTGIQGLYGWQFADGSASPPALASATVQPEGNRILFTLAAAPTGRDPRLAYATQRSSGGGGLDGPQVGARGLLRGSAGHASILDGSLQFDWALSQIIRL
ncbi:hypothetical protein [Pseudoroseomonas cervicalis]|uniref:hypothetical protein n=1 Tax=Teichococcus cervicalis TaxID=204525 RepID=UPI0022F14AD7|nr:hypothetical protein [Pseudoroseomonas cervicalis]WBV42717.1 hypothetical protein PFY06_15955 [Pseudoroseomonas cervicalis]